MFGLFYTEMQNLICSQASEGVKGTWRAHKDKCNRINKKKAEDISFHCTHFLLNFRIDEGWNAET